MNETHFFAALQALAAHTGTDLNEMALTWYDEALSRFGYEKLCHLCKEFYGELEPGKRNMPTIKQFLEKLGHAPSDPKALAKEVAGRIVSAVSKHGHPNLEAAKEYIGDVGWRVVEMQGGWAEVCDTLTYNNKTTFQAQCRDLAQALMDKAKAGLPIDKPPSFDDVKLSPALQNALAIAEGKKELTE